jgi:hypothetical protein
MHGERAPHRFDVFERRKNKDVNFTVWHGTYTSLAEAQDKLWSCAAESPSEFYVKDLQLGLVVARSNLTDGA